MLAFPRETKNLNIRCAQRITMLAVKDSMTLIHLAKTSLLETSCDYFKTVIIPKLAYKEVMKGLKHGYVDAKVVEKVAEMKKLTVLEVKVKELIRKANEFNIQGGEAEGVALYWQEKADILATDDDNVRKKGFLLGIRAVGTPAIMLKLHREGLINSEKFRKAVEELRTIGWFSNGVLDMVLMEGKR